MDVVRYLPVGPLLLGVLFILVLASVSAVLWLRRRRVRAAITRSSRVLLAGAVLAVLLLTQVGSHGAGGMNLVPGAGIHDEWGNINRGLAVVNIAGNVAMFVPPALLAPLALGWRLRRTSLAGAGLSILVELTQVVTGRSGDIDDVLLNTVGALIGASLGVLVTRSAWWSRGDEVQGAIRRLTPAGSRREASERYPAGVTATPSVESDCP